MTVTVRTDTHALGRRSDQHLAEEHAAKSILGASVRLVVAPSWVVGEVLNHRLVGVEADFGQLVSASLLLGHLQQPGARAQVA
jgi:hypothetical protein